MEKGSEPRYLQIKVTPRSATSELTQLPDGTWTAKLKSPPVDGKANDELTGLVAKALGCARSAVTIKTGAGSRLKLVRVEGGA